MSLPSLPSIPNFTTCSEWLHRNVGITLMYKDKTGFITGATVKFKSGFWSTAQVANTNGILYYLCVPLNYSVEVTAQKDGIDFGNGEGTEASVGYATIGTMSLGDYIFPAFVSKTYFPCPVGITPNIGLYNFESSLPTAIPNITVLPITGYIPDSIGSFSVTEGSYSIKLDEEVIANGKMPSSGKLDINLPHIKDIPSLKNKTSTTVEVIINWYQCTFKGSKTVSLPIIPTEPVKPTLPTSCADLVTTVESNSMPDILPSDSNIPFMISLNNIRLQCPSTGASDKITNGIGTVKLGNLPSITFPIPSSGQSAGSVYLDVFKLYKNNGIDMSQILNAAQTSAPIITPTTTPKPSEIEFETRARLEGRLGTTAGYIVPLATVQAYVTAIKPGTIVEQQPYGSSWYGTYKIIRPNGSYMWASEYSTINKFL